MSKIQMTGPLELPQGPVDMGGLNARIPAESLARFVHETYERLAPQFGYCTRTESAVPWEQVPEANRRLMVAVAEAALRMLAESR